MPSSSQKSSFSIATLQEILRNIPKAHAKVPRNPSSRRPSFDLTLETVYENEPLKLSND